ncbi:MAG: hypothetical protein ACQEV7_11420 [Bacillota bacterium]
MNQDNIEREIEDNIEQFDSNVIKEITGTVNMSLNDYININYETLFSENIEKYSSLKEILLSVMFKQEINSIKPYIYLNNTENNGVILEKTADGTNNVYIVEVRNGKFEIVETKTAKGQQMRPDF